jgi:hypothetical protein
LKENVRAIAIQPISRVVVMEKKLTSAATSRSLFLSRSSPSTQHTMYTHQMVFGKHSAKGIRLFSSESKTHEIKDDYDMGKTLGAYVQTETESSSRVNIAASDGVTTRLSPSN